MRTIRYTFAFVTLIVAALVAQQWDQVNGSMQVSSSTTTPLMIVNQQGSGKIASFRLNGVEKYAVGNGGQSLAPDGTAGAPSYSYASDTDTGQYTPGAGLQSFVSNASPFVLLGNNVFRLGSAITLGWSSGTNPNIAADDVILSRGAADRLDLATGDSFSLVSGGLGVGVAETTAGRVRATAGYSIATVAASGTAPTIPVACTSPTVAWNNGTAAFQIDVGTSCAGISTLALTMPAATNAWVCVAFNTTTAATAEVEMTASTTTSATFTNYTRTTGIVLAWVDGADIRIGCWGG